MISKAALRASKRSTEVEPDSMEIGRSFTTFVSAVSMERWALKAD